MAVPPRRDIYERCLGSVTGPDDLVVWESSVVVGLRKLRIAAVLFTPQRNALLHSSYIEAGRETVTLLDLVVRFGETELAEELVKLKCSCTLDFDSSLWFSPHWDRLDILIHPWVYGAWCWVGTPFKITTYPDWCPPADWDLPLDSAQENANTPVVHAGLAVVAHGGQELVAAFPQHVKVRLLDAAVLLGMPQTVTMLSKLVGFQPIRRLTFFDAARALHQPKVLEALICASTGFWHLFADVRTTSGPYHRPWIYYNLSIFELAILRGREDAATLLNRAKMDWFSLKQIDLDWSVAWVCRVPDGLHDLEIALPEQRWQAASLVVKSSLSRAGANFGPVLIQLMGANRMPLVDHVLYFAVEVPTALWDMLEAVNMLPASISEQSHSGDWPSESSRNMASSPVAVDMNYEESEIVCEEAEMPAQIDPEEAEIIVAIQQADYVQRLAHSHTYTTSDEQSEAESDIVYLLEFNRHPKDLVDALSNGKPLAKYREALQSDGHEWQQLSGALIFVHPHQFRLVMKALNGKQVHRGHVIISESIEYLLEESLQSVRKGAGAWVKVRTRLNIDHGLSACSAGGTQAPDYQYDVDAESNAENEGLYEQVIQRTFLCVAPRLLDNATVVQSTTEAHSRCRNPRRFNPECFL